MTKEKTGIFHRIYHSIYIDNQNQTRKSTTRNFILHLHPATIPEKTLKFTHTFGLGGMAALLIVILASSGLLLRFFYKPFPLYAYESILNIQNSILFGGFIRNIHYWSATLLLIITFLHLLRVFFTRAFLAPRQFNWIIGLSLFLLAILSNYTGYLLPWDQLSYWAITVSTNMLSYIPFIGDTLMHLLRGGDEVGAQTLIIYYNLHTGVIPIFIVLLMVYHFWRIRKAGGVVIPDNKSDEKIAMTPTIPNLIYREFVVALALVAFILILAILFDAPLLEKANPALSPDPVKAPWYFLGIQELLLHFDPFFAIVIIPGILIVSLFLIPYYNYSSAETGIWFFSQQGKKLAIVSALNAFLLTIMAVISSEYWLKFSNWMPGLPLSISNGLIPFLLVSLIIVLFYLWLKRHNDGKNDLAIQSLFIFMVSILIILTIIAIGFRGVGMRLFWPFW